jgi:hypothetical protein
LSQDRNHRDIGPRESIRQPIQAGSRGTVAGSLSPLRDFPVLSKLVVSLPVLFGTDDINVGRRPSLSAYLPPALEHLTITDDLYRYSESQEYFEDENAMAFFRSYLLTRRWAPNG